MRVIKILNEKKKKKKLFFLNAFKKKKKKKKKHKVVWIYWKNIFPLLSTLKIF